MFSYVYIIFQLFLYCRLFYKKIQVFLLFLSSFSYCFLKFVRFDLVYLEKGAYLFWKRAKVPLTIRNVCFLILGHNEKAQASFECLSFFAWATNRFPCREIYIFIEEIFLYRHSLPLFSSNNNPKVKIIFLIGVRLLVKTVAMRVGA